MRRVVITGIGAVTPLGNCFKDSWEYLKKGVSGIGEITKFDSSGIPWKAAGEVKDFNAGLYLDSKEKLRLDTFVHYAVAASVMAVEDAGLIEQKSEVKSQKSDPPQPPLYKGGIRGGVIIGSSRGGITTIEKELQKKCGSRFTVHGSRLSPYLMPSTTISMAASYAAQKLNIKGNCLGISNACSSGANAIGEAFRLIKYRLADIALAGGTEAPVCRTCVEGYGISGALSKIEGSSASRPFDKTRCGFVIAEGASVIVLEEYQSALKRNAKIYCEIAGYGNTTDSFHMTKPHSEGEMNAIAAAMEEAGVSPGEVDYINAHGTSTLLGDSTEAAAIKKAFKDQASKIPVSSIKSMTGHMLAASGAFEIACTAMSINKGVIPPTINLKEKDPGCDINVVTELRQTPVGIAISNSFGFGGVNAVLVLKAIN